MSNSVSLPEVRKRPHRGVGAKAMPLPGQGSLPLPVWLGRGLGQSYPATVEASPAPLVAAVTVYVLPCLNREGRCTTLNGPGAGEYRRSGNPARILAFTHAVL